MNDASELHPELQPGVFAFCSATRGTTPPSEAVAWFREAEGLSIVLPIRDAVSAGFVVEFEAAWITLGVQSDLAAVGLTARVSSALAAEGIACNVIAACRHDHLFVPSDRAVDAMRILQGIQFP